MTKKILSVIILCIAVVILCQPVYASGIGISPTTISVSDAMRGDICEKIIGIHNPSSEELGFIMYAEGDAGDWVSFYDYEEGNELLYGAIPPNGKAYVLLKVEIPSDAANGDYDATIYASTESPDDTGEGGMQAVFRANAKMTVTVTDIQRISGSVDYISVRDGELTLPVAVEVKFTNTGNVIAKPVITIVMKKDGETVDQITTDDTQIDVSSSDVIQTEWDTTEQKSGKYTADVSVSLDGRVLKQESVPFELFPVGTLTQEGEFVSITSDGALHPGTLLKIIGTFKNTGEGGTQAKMVGEVLRNGNLIKTIESDELLVPVYASEQLTSYLDLTDVGDYVVTAHMIYAGKKTDEQELAFTVSEASEEPDASTTSDSGGVALPENTRTPVSTIPVVSAVLIAGLFMALRKKE